MLQADIDRTQPPAAGPLPAIHFPKTVTETLENGLRVFILPTNKQPMVTARLLFQGGNYKDGDQAGLADLVAALLNKGTDELSAEEFAQQTDSLAISVEASSGPDSFVVTASGLSRDSAKVFEFLYAAVAKPAFREEEIEKEKTKMLAALVQKKSEPGALASRLRAKLLFGDQPYGDVATPESVQSITQDDIVYYHRTWLYPLCLATLAIVGDVDPQTVLTQLRSFAKPTPFAMSHTSRSRKPFPEIEGITVHVVDRPASVQSNVILCERSVARNNPDVPGLTVLNSVLGGGMSGRLFKNLRETHGYTYGAYSGIRALKLSGAFSAAAEVRNEVTGAAVGEILAELQRLSAEPIPEDELATHRQFLIGNFLMSVENDQRTAERRQEIDLYGLPEDYYETFAARMSEVTPAMAQELAKKHFDPGNLFILVVGEAKDITPQLEKFGKPTVYDTDLHVKPQE